MSTRSRTFVVKLHSRGRPWDQIEWASTALSDGERFEASEAAPGQWYLSRPIEISVPDDLPEGATWALYEAEHPAVPILAGAADDLIRRGDRFVVPLTDVYVSPIEDTP